jgi:uncharacterized membrane protein HdeD (DUF308 family)
MDDLLARYAARATTDVEHQLAEARWAVGARGLLAIAFGAAIAIWPAMSLLALTYVFGAASVFYGVVTLASAVHSQSSRRFWLLLLAAVDFAAGIAVLAWPSLSALALLYAIGAWAIAAGALLLAAPLWISGAPAAFVAPVVLAGGVLALLGVVTVVRPGDGALALLGLIAAFSIAAGVLLVAASVHSRVTPRRRSLS